MSERSILLECTYCQTVTPLHEFKGKCPSCGEVIVEARYDGAVPDVQAWLKQVRRRPRNLWRYREVLPLYDSKNIVTLHEGCTPLIHAEVLGSALGLKNLFIKDERQNPTASFKDRQATVAISALKEMGVDQVVVASTGNVAIAYGAYGARAGIQIWGFFPQLAPNEKLREAAIYGTEIIKTTGSYDQTKELAAHFAQTKGYFLDKGIKSVASIEAMKTMAYEIAEQLGEYLHDGEKWVSPDWFLQGVSGGMGPIGVGKGFRELKQQFGLVDSLPKFGMIQSTGCAPMVQAFERKQRVATPVEHPQTVIATLATGNPGRAYQILYDYVQENGGTFVSATDEEAFNAIRLLARYEGLSVEPATGVTFAGLIKMAQMGLIHPDEVVVVNCSGHTMPVEKRILGSEWQKLIDMSDAGTAPTVPEDRLVSAVNQLSDGNLRRVVVIEDNESAARLMSRILESRENCEVYVAGDGVSGLRAIREVRPDLVITDLMMPDVDGFGVIEQMKADTQLRHIPIVVVTAKELTAQERNQLMSQAEMVLQKGSFIDENFMQVLMQHLG